MRAHFFNNLNNFKSQESVNVFFLVFSGIKVFICIKIFLQSFGKTENRRHFVDDPTAHYLNNRVFLSRSYRMMVAPRKFDVLKTNICPRSEASRANMLVLRPSNFQGATFKPIVPRPKRYCLVSIIHH